MTPDQARNARMLLGWSPTKLAHISGLPLTAVLTLERIGAADVAEVQRTETALTRAGAEFDDEDGDGRWGASCNRHLAGRAARMPLAARTRLWR